MVPRWYPPIGRPIGTPPRDTHITWPWRLRPAVSYQSSGAASAPGGNTPRALYGAGADGHPEAPDRRPLGACPYRRQCAECSPSKFIDGLFQTVMGTSPAGWRQLYVSDIKPYGCHSRRGHRRTACFHTPLVKPKRGPTARTCTRGRCTFRLPSRRWRWVDRSDRLVVWQIGHTVLSRVERKIALGFQQLVLKARTGPKIGRAHGRL